MSRPWMPLYCGDYIADTLHLSTQEHGAYLLLMMHYWQRKGLPTDDTQLARIARVELSEWLKMRPTIQAFFSDDWKHKRIEFELSEAARASAAAKRAGEASARARKEKPTPVERPLNARSNETPTEGQRLQSQPHIDVDGGSPRDQAFNLAFEIGRIAGYDDATCWPPPWLQAPQRVQTYLGNGWQPETMVATAKAVMAKKRDGPPGSIVYFEEAFARAHALQSAPLPTVEILPAKRTAVYEQQPRANSALAAVREIGRRLVDEENRDSVVSLSERRLCGPS